MHVRNSKYGRINGIIDFTAYGDNDNISTAKPTFSVSSNIKGLTWIVEIRNAQHFRVGGHHIESLTSSCIAQCP